MADEVKTLNERVVAGEPITREEAAKHFNERGIKFICRGHRVHTVEEEKALVERYRACETLEQRVALKTELEDKFKMRPEQRKPASSMEEAHSNTLPLIFAYADSVARRKDVCGQDMGPVFLADGRFDGEPHEIKCPKCGEIHSHSVYYNVSD
jgi:phage FluMu protein Com